MKWNWKFKPCFTLFYKHVGYVSIIDVIDQGSDLSIFYLKILNFFNWIFQNFTFFYSFFDKKNYFSKSTLIISFSAALTILWSAWTKQKTRENERIWKKLLLDRTFGYVKRKKHFSDFDRQDDKIFPLWCFCRTFPKVLKFLKFFFRNKLISRKNHLPSFYSPEHITFFILGFLKQIFYPSWRWRFKTSLR